MSTEFFDLHKKYDSLKARPKYVRDWHYLYDLYPMYFEPIRKELKLLLEIGVYKGGSVKALHDYFVNAEIVGVDIDLTPANNFGLPDEKMFGRITLIEADQENCEQMREVGDRYGSFPIIIDDAGHVHSAQLASFETLWPYVSAGGLYIIEDVFKGFDQTSKLLQYFKDFINKNNFLSPGPYDSSKEKKEISGITFHQGMIVIRKVPENINVS
jgi:hypothetical protein